MAMKKQSEHHAHPTVNDIDNLEAQPDQDEQKLVSRRYTRRFSTAQHTRRRSPRNRRILRDLVLGEIANASGRPTDSSSE